MEYQKGQGHDRLPVIVARVVTQSLHPGFSGKPFQIHTNSVNVFPVKPEQNASVQVPQETLHFLSSRSFNKYDKAVLQRSRCSSGLK